MIDLFQSSLKTFRCFFSPFFLSLMMILYFCSFRGKGKMREKMREKMTFWMALRIPSPSLRTRTATSPGSRMDFPPSTSTSPLKRHGRIEARSPVSRKVITPLAEVKKNSYPFIMPFLGGYNSTYITNRAHLVVDIMIGR